MSAVRTSVLRRALICSAAFTLFGVGQFARAQTFGGSVFDNSSPAGPIVSPAAAPGPLISPYSAPSPASSSTPPQLDFSGSGAGTGPLAKTPLTGPAGPSFQLNATVNASEAYVTNADGVGSANEPDYLTILGLSSDLHDHTRRISLDANYNLTTDFYARGTEETQVSNYLQALGTVDIIPSYVDLGMRAFAQPVVTSGLGAVTADNRVVPGTYSDSYGYFANPNLTFNLGGFATSQTMPSYGQIFFTTPTGTTNTNTIPSLGTPTDTTMRSVTETISSGPDFGHLSWRLVGLYSETDSTQYLLTEKSGIGNARYAIDYQWSLLFTGGYDAINDSVALLRNVSGPVALGGFGLKLGSDFDFEIEAGERYNNLSLTSSLRYAINPTSQIVASVNDYVQTPQGQLLNNLVGLTPSGNGTLTSSQDVFGNGSESTLGSFNLQSPTNPALDQFVSRYQVGSISWVEDFDRNNVSFSLFGTRRTYLVAGFTGPETSNSWGASLLVSRNLSPLLVAKLGAAYNVDQEFGGQGETASGQGELDYALSRTTNIYLMSSYLTRSSSPSLQSLSPLTGDTSDLIVRVGISHTL
jgi:uncharacterized protein (PEP-CTERM system associated)